MTREEIIRALKSAGYWFRVMDATPSDTGDRFLVSTKTATVLIKVYHPEHVDIRGEAKLEIDHGTLGRYCTYPNCHTKRSHTHELWAWGIESVVKMFDAVLTKELESKVKKALDKKKKTETAISVDDAIQYHTLKLRVLKAEEAEAEAGYRILHRVHLGERLDRLRPEIAILETTISKLGEKP